MSQLINVTTGQENQSSGSAQVSVWHTPRLPQQRHLKEAYLSGCAKNVEYRDIATSFGAPAFMQAVTGIPEEIGGRWVTQSYQIAEGEILKIFATRKGGYGQHKYTGNLLIGIREQAPLMRVRIPLLSTPKSTRGVADITGRFDILTLPEAQARGVYVPPQFAHLFEPESTEFLFETTELEPAVAPKKEVTVQVVTNTEGVQKAIAVKTRRRMLDTED
jgi:hypothetical protein